MMFDANQRHAAKLYLESFGPAARRKGRALVRRGETGPVHLNVNGSWQRVLEAVQGQAVQLMCNGTQWGTACECKRPECEHSYAALMKVLQIDSVPSAKDQVDASGNVDAALNIQLATKLGRKLTAAETRFVNEIEAFHTVVSKGGKLTKWDLADHIHFNTFDAAFDVPVHANQRLNQIDFWHQIVRYIRKYKGEIPEFMLPITSLAEIEREEVRARWNEEVQKWKHALTHIPDAPEASPTILQIDLRLRIEASSTVLEVQPAPEKPFQTVSNREWEKVTQRISEGTAQFSPEVLPIFAIFGSIQYPYAANVLIQHSDRATRRILANLFRNPALRSRLVNSKGEPFEYCETPLAWRLQEADRQYYEISLGADGISPGKITMVLPGAPTLYLTNNTVYAGPPLSVQLDAGPHRIPAPALETKQGVNLLRALGLPFPEAIQKRTRAVRMKVTLACHLARIGYDLESEYFIVQVTAVPDAAEVNVAQSFIAGNWVDQTKARKTQDNFFYVFDRKMMHAVPDILSGMRLGWNYSANCWSSKVGKNFAERFLGWFESLPPELELKLDQELATLVQDPVHAQVQLECQEVGVDWFDLRTSIKVEDTTLTPEEIQLLLNAHGKAVRLPGKGWRRLAYEISEEQDQSLARLGLSAYDLSPEPQRLHALQLADRAAEAMLAAEQFRKIQERAAEIKTRVTPEIPPNVHATLRPYQLEGYHFLAYLAENHFGGILADDMGLGKTVQALTWLAWLSGRTEARKPSLVVCPKSVMDNWVSEARKFVPSLRLQMWKMEPSGQDNASAEPTASNRTLTQVAAGCDLLVLNYSQLRSVAEEAAKIEFLAVILDEAQYIKNPDSQSAQAARSLRSAHRLALSGTPIENRLLDLWSLMHFAMPGVLGNRANFKRRFDSSTDALARRRLASRVRPFLLRRTKDQVATDLPDRTEEDLYCEIEGTQRTLYRAELKRAQQMLLKVQSQKELNEFRFNFLTSLLRLRQICCHPGLVDVDFKQDESAKLTALIELLDPLMEEGHKVLIFSQFVQMLEIVKSAVVAKGWTHFYLDGSTENRGELVQRFQEQSGAALFLISLKAGGFGLNLTAASYVVVFDPWWNPAVENQAIDRTHRIGQTQKVIAYRLLVKNSIEEKIRTLQKQKAGLVQNILGDEAFSSSLTVQDLHYLFADGE